MSRTLMRALSVLAIWALFHQYAGAAPGSSAEAQATAADIIVTSLLDDGSAGTLRHAIGAAANGQVISFDAGLAGGTIVLNSELGLTKSLSIVGPPGGITLSGNRASRVFRMGFLYQVTLEGLTIRDGYADPFIPFGGAIYSNANLLLRSVTIEGNWAANGGAGITQAGGTLTIDRSTIALNGVNALTGALTQFGGGLLVFDTVATLSNTTVSGNLVSSSGGGLFNDRSSVLLLHATVADNGANGGGGVAVFATVDEPATTTLQNSIVAMNFAATATGGPDLLEYFTNDQWHARHSLVGTTTGYTLDTDVENQLGVTPRFVLDGFGRALLADNGGPTRTHALLDDSPALDVAEAGACADSPVDAIDQRGVARPQGAGCDLGAFELEAPVVPPVSVSALTINGSGTVDKRSGIAYLTGTVTCPTAGIVNLAIDITQVRNQRRLTVTVTGASAVSVPCDGTTGWAAAVPGGNGVFTSGGTTVNATTDNVTPAVSAAGSVRLFWSR